MKIDSGALYYSQLPNEAFPQGKAQPPASRRGARPSASPRRTTDGPPSSISNAVVTSFSSARRIRDRARSLVPTKLPSPAQCVCAPVASGKTKRGADDEAIPVIFYLDEDTVAKPVAQRAVTFVDPFAFGESESPDEMKDAQDSRSPTSVGAALFPGKSTNNHDIAPADDAGSSEEASEIFDKVVTFDCPIFAHDFKNEEDTSIEISEAIKSINALSIEEARGFRKSILKEEAAGEYPEGWRDPMLSWQGFEVSPNFNVCEWDPNADEFEVENSRQA